jgi:hypothetical protein
MVSALLLACSSLKDGKEAESCPAGFAWEKYTTSSVSYRSPRPSNVSITWFTDGLYAKVAVGDSVKETYRLKNGLYLFRGLEPSDWQHVGPFFMLDMAAGIAPAIVAQRFKDPCSVPSRSTEFEFVMPKDSLLDMRDAKVSGSAIREGTTVTYQVRADGRPRGADIDAAGVIQFSTRVPIPADLVIEDWEIAESGSDGPFAWNRVPRKGDLKTIRDLYAFRAAP